MALRLADTTITNFKALAVARAAVAVRARGREVKLAGGPAGPAGACLAAGTWARERPPLQRQWRSAGQQARESKVRRRASSERTSAITSCNYHVLVREVGRCSSLLRSSPFREGGPWEERGLRAGTSPTIDWEKDADVGDRVSSSTSHTQARTKF